MQKSVIILLLALLTSVMAEEVLFQSDFAANPDLKGWTDVFQKSPPSDKNIYQVTEFEGEKCLKTGKSCFGLSHSFSRPLVIDEKLKKVTLEVTFFQQQPYYDYQVEIALSSRKSVSENDGRAFWPLRDSGFIASGYFHNLQKSNSISYQINGKSVKGYRPFEPFNFLTATNKWITWRLEYDHAAKELRFFNDKNETEPFVTMYQVDLSGVELNSVWLTAWYLSYSHVKVYCEF